MVKGPCSAAVARLLTIGWWPSGPGFWIDHKNLAWESTEQQTDWRPLLVAAREAVETRNWAKTSEHHQGGGAAKGVEVKTLKATQKELRKEERFEEAAVLGAANAAAIWSPARAKEEGYPQVPSCTLCGETAPDDHHRVWTCRGLDRSDALTKDSEDLEEKAKQEKDDLSVFWTRGLPPKEWFEVEPHKIAPRKGFSK